MIQFYLKNQKKLFFLLFLFMVHSASFAQSIQGRVLGEQNTPLPGVSIRNHTQNIATLSDENGYFTVQGKEGDSLSFTFVGYESYQTILSSSSDMTVTLQVDEQALDEVVILGYGSIEKSKLTGSVSRLDDSSRCSREYRKPTAQNTLANRFKYHVGRSNSGRRPESWLRRHLIKKI